MSPIPAVSDAIQACSDLMGLGMAIHRYTESLDRVVGEGRRLHDNRFCLLAKRCSNPWSRDCVRLDVRTVQRAMAERPAPVLKFCFGGAGEIVLPIQDSGVLAGVIFLGPFRWIGPVPEAALCMDDAAALPGPASLAESMSCLPEVGPEQIDNLVTVGQLLVSHMEAALAESTPLPGDTQDNGELIEAYIKRNFAQRLRLPDLARHLCLSTSHTSALVKKHFAMGFNDLLARVRIGFAKQLLANSAYRVERIADMVGMNDAPCFHRRFKRATGLTPRQYRESVLGRARGPTEV